MGEVHLAADTRLGRMVALKLLPPDLREDPDRRARFLREARAVAQLNHPHITQIFDIGEAEGRDYLAFELVEGHSLQEHLAGQPLPIAELAELALPLADAIAYAHDKGIVHRDIKAANVMVTPRGHPKLLDFGLAKLLREGTQAPGPSRNTTLTIQGAIFGTPGAMSPEQALGRTVDARSDIFSFGSLLYEMATGRAAFRGTTVMETLSAVIHHAPEPMARLRPDLPPEFVGCVEKALRKDPTERYQTMNDLAADLRHWKRTTESGLVPPVEERGGRHRAFAAAAALALAALCYLGWRALAPKAAPKTGAEERRALAVLPFDVLGDAGTDGAFAAGLHSDVVTRLSKIGSLKVIARNSVQEYAGSKKPLSTIGEELSVDALLTGELQHADKALRLNLTLHDSRSKDNLWAESYDRELTSKDLFAVQREIAESVARALHVQLSLAERTELRGVPTTNDRAYEAYLRGMSLHDGKDVASMRSAIEALETAVELDPQFAMAWAALSEAHGYHYWLVDQTDTSRLAACGDAARRALRISPGLPDGHLALGEFHYISRDYAAAAREYDLAERGLPGSAKLQRLRGWLYRRIGNWEAAAETLERGIELSPREAELHFELGTTLLFLGRYEASTRAFERRDALSGDEHNLFRALSLLERDGRLGPEAAALTTPPVQPETGNELVLRWRLRIFSGDLDAARAELAGLPRELTGQWHVYPSALLAAMTEDIAGNVQAARPAYETARDQARARIEVSPSNALPHAALALALAGLGEKGEAVAEAQRAVDMLPIERDSVVGVLLLLDRFHVLLRVGDLDAAVRALDEYLSHPGPFSLRTLRLDPRLEVLVGHSEFERLRERHERARSRQ